MPELTTPGAWMLIAAILSYLIGAVPFGIVMARLFGLGDLRRIGSGNIGATNVMRTGNKLAAFLTLLGDAGKGGLAVLCARLTLGEDAAQLAGLAAFVGHAWPVWLGFRGGKGVATFLGTVLMLAFPLGLAACATWLAAAAITRISSLGAIAAAVATPLWALWLRPDAVGLGVVFAVMIVVFHRHNIARLRAGTEPRIGRK
ncbi:glycerol-3-phosphate 1-O-acyltransferase PlsY [Jannaschia sp. S6380]|uniref:glycerol-3-phosphate 1-O-acyltransferase PlsY n=1 Tax=Jannaschia sp. S6380 TaxID=2926408 RepID=UPI001FF53B57|nr:glycerol-3-phosphate 1-O-acyltransferase PlsY [Jannaschia sp. S6380]MCK0169138.1 glycerol-3-phosphate 1-O-acyltransferase PlsY [Jannaschia sp. S6380]